MKHTIPLTISTIFFSAFLLTSTVSIPVHAQESQNQESQQSVLTSLSVTPPLSEIVIKPGKTITQAFTIKNEGKVDLEVPRPSSIFPRWKNWRSHCLPNNTQFPFARLENLDKTTPHLHFRQESLTNLW